MAGISWFGRRNCTCMRDFMAVYTKRLRYQRPVIQAGYNAGSVRASAGTHDGGGVADMRTPTWEEMRLARTMGYIEWKRTPAQGFSYHGHGALRGCPHLSSGAAYQVSEKINYNRNGLAGRGRDDGPQVTIPKWSTWYAAWKKAQSAAQKKAQEAAKKKRAAEAKKAAAEKALLKKLGAQKIPRTLASGKVVWEPGITAVRLKFIIESRANRTYSRHSYVAQGWLQRVKLYPLAKAGTKPADNPRDGVWGPVSQKAWDRFATKFGFPTGRPTLAGLRKLGDIVNTQYPIKES